MSLFKILTFLDQLSLEQRGHRMKPLEREILNTVWENKPYRDVVGFQEQTVKNKAPKLWEYLSQLLNTKISKENVRQVLEQLNIDDILAVRSNSTAESLVCGRSVEIFQLQQWIEVQKSKLIFIHGMRGIGKTYIANKIAELLSPNLDYLVWISLENPVPLIDILPIIIKRIGGGKATKISRNTSIAIDKTIEYLKEKRCLLILDDADAILENRSTNMNNPLIADYIEFFDRLNSVKHNSCCLIISEQKVVDYKFNYQQLAIKELDWQSCQMIFAKDELKGSPIDWERLVNKYSGNPQYLKSIAPTIKSVFDGNIARFLDANILLYDRTEKLIAEQLERLSPDEMTLIMCMAAEGKAMTLEQLLARFKGKISDRQLLKTVDRSLDKCLVVVKHGRFILSDLVAEYMMDRYEDLKINCCNDGCVSVRITSRGTMHRAPTDP